MNKPIANPLVRASPSYDADGYGWALAQAELIRARRWEEVDWENVAEEIDSVGRSERRAAESALRVLILHVLKWKYQPQRRSKSWMFSIRAQRVRFAREFRDNPSLAPLRDVLRVDAYELAKLEAAQETDLPLKTFPEEPLDWATILDMDVSEDDIPTR